MKKLKYLWFISAFMSLWIAGSQASNIIPSPFSLLGTANTWTAFQTFSGGASIGGVATSGTDVQLFTSSGTWTKPATTKKSSTAIALIKCWGGGGSGAARATIGRAGGGAGGAFNWVALPLSKLGATETVTIPAAAAGVSGNTAGNPGGNATFGSWLTAYGGGQGTTAAAAGAYGGDGGGRISAGVNHTNGGVTTASRFGAPAGVGLPLEGSMQWDTTNLVNFYSPPRQYQVGMFPINGGGMGGDGAVANNGENSFNGGAGGGVGDTPGAGGNSINGAAGGAGWSSTAGGTRTGGTSLYGGNGGASGAAAGGGCTAGAQPGGGGGGDGNGATSCAGAKGQCEVDVF